MSHSKTQSDGNPHESFRPEIWSTVDTPTSYSLDKSETGSTIKVTVDGVSFNLPKVGKDTAPSGTNFTIIIGDEERGISTDIFTDQLSLSDAIIGSVVSSRGVLSSDGTPGNKISLVFPTTLPGDRITLKSDGINGWYITNGIGEWLN